MGARAQDRADGQSLIANREVVCLPLQPLDGRTPAGRRSAPGSPMNPAPQAQLSSPQLAHSRWPAASGCSSLARKPADRPAGSPRPAASGVKPPRHRMLQHGSLGVTSRRRCRRLWPRSARQLSAGASGQDYARALPAHQQQPHRRAAQSARPARLRETDPTAPAGYPHPGPAGQAPRLLCARRFPRHPRWRRTRRRLSFPRSRRSLHRRYCAAGHGRHQGKPACWWPARHGPSGLPATLRPHSKFIVAHGVPGEGGSPAVADDPR